MPGIHDLPYEILAQIASLLLLPDLENLSAESAHLRSICEKALLEESQLKKEYRCIVQEPSLKGNGRVYGNIFELWEEVSRLQVTSYIENLHLEWILPTMRPDDPWYISSDILSRLKTAARQCPFLETEEENALVEDAVGGNKNAVLAILLPQLSNLQYIRLPEDYYDIDDDQENDTDWITIVLCRIAKASATRPAALPNLRVIDHYEHWTSNSNDLRPINTTRLASLLTITTVREVFIYSCMLYTYCWPVDLPKSHVEELTFRDSILSVAALKGFVRGIQGPCVLRQTHYEEFSYDHIAEDWPCWTSCKITADGQVSKKKCLHEFLDEATRFWEEEDSDEGDSDEGDSDEGDSDEGGSDEGDEDS